jgi:hypothetical protein
LKLNSLVSWIANTWRPRAATDVGSHQPSIRRSTVTLRLARKRPKRTSCERCPPSWRRQAFLRATMRPNSAARLFPGGDPRTGPTTNLPRPASRHSGKTKVPNTESHNPILTESTSCVMSHFVAPRCVHALARRRGSRRRPRNT